MGKPLSDAVRRLQEIAEEDLRVAAACLELRPPAVRTAAFHSQQAAEKQLKAWLVALGDPDPPEVHSLPALARLIAGRGGPVLTEEPLRLLSRFAVGPRYGLAHVTLPEAERGLTAAQQIVEQATRAVAALMGS